MSCVIPHYRQHKQLATCLAALAAQQNAGAFEVLVVDDGSGVPPALREARLDVKLLHAAHKGPAAARNFGAAQARAAILAFTDSDCRPSPGWLAAVVRTFKCEKDVVAVVGPLFDRTPPARGFGLRVLAHRFMQTISVLDHRPIEITYGGIPFLGTIGANFAVSRQWFERLGGFDESFAQPGGEDYDLGFRLQLAGGRVVFCPQAEVEHHYLTDRRALTRRWINYGVGKIQFATKHAVDPIALDLVCSRRLHFLTRLPAILRAAQRHYPASIARGFSNRLVRFYVEWLFQLGAIRGYRNLAAVESGKPGDVYAKEP